MKKITKILSMTLAVVMLCTVFATTAFAAGYSWADNFPLVSATSNSKHITVYNAQVIARACTGTAIDVDGNFGEKTTACVKDFQNRYNLKADGMVGSDTWFIMNGRLEGYPSVTTGYFRIKYDKQNHLTDNDREMRNSSGIWYSYSPTLGWKQSSY